MTINDFVADIVRHALPDGISSQIEHIEGAMEGAEGCPVCYIYPKKDCRLFHGFKEDQGCFFFKRDTDCPSGYSIKCILGDDYRDAVLGNGGI